MSKPLLLIVIGFSCLQACTPSSETLKPVALQNQENLTALSNNTQVMLAFYEPLLTSAGNTLIYQTLGKLEQEMIAVVGAAQLPPDPNQTWEMLFTNSAQTALGKHDKYLERYTLVRSTLARGVEDEDMLRLKQREGWIYTAASDPNFTPLKCHDLIKSLSALRKSGKTGDAFYSEAETLFTPIDPMLQARRETVNQAKLLLAGLKQEIGTQLHIANVHANAITHFAESQVDLDKTIDTTRGSLANLDFQKIDTTLSSLSKKFLNNPSYRDAAVSMLMSVITRKKL
ncbi:MAG: hypothetical protein PHP00_12155 [Thiotrichaceae bacterium]|nr:hypothetical protein [Thiotrichaceae bacterium]